MKCEKCNKENPSDARFCWNCGEKLPPSGPIIEQNYDKDILSQLDKLFNN